MKIAIIGCGNMGMTYAHSFLRFKIASREELLLVEKNTDRKLELQKQNLGSVVEFVEPGISDYDIIILAVKPQDFDMLYPVLKDMLTPKNTIVSIMAGITMKTLQEKLEHGAIIRAMPNTPAQVGMGVTGFTATSETTIDQIRKVENLLNATGKTVFFEDGTLLDAVTALSGSGPAYFFYILKAMVEAGIKMGMEPSVATMLVNQTMLGSFHLFNSSTKSLDELIDSVTSKGGTTEAAFKVLNDKELDKCLIDAILSAEKRGKELSQV